MYSWNATAADSSVPFDRQRHDVQVVGLAHIARKRNRVPVVERHDGLQRFAFPDDEHDRRHRRRAVGVVNESADDGSELLDLDGDVAKR